MAATKHAQLIQKDSQDYLTEALFQLLEKKSLEEIKVTELVTRAGVSRMAFYRNYQGLEDIIRQYFAPKLSRMFDNVIFQKSATTKLQDMQTFFDEFAAQLRLSTQRNYEYLIRDLFTENMSHYYENWTGLDPVKQRYWSVFMTNGVYGIWREWMLSGQREPFANLHKLIKTLQDTTELALKQR